MIFLSHGLSEIDNHVLHQAQVLVDPPEGRSVTIHAQRRRKVVKYIPDVHLLHVFYRYTLHHVRRRNTSILIPHQDLEGEFRVARRYF